MSPLTMAEALIAEYRQESRATRAMLERVPEASFDWKPHERSMAMGRLAAHVAETPGWAEQILGADELDFAAMEYTPPEPSTTAELLELHDRSSETFTTALDGAADATLLAKWVLRSGDHVISKGPRIAMLRGFVLSHLIHHRGQLSVYLRLRDVPVPATYGPTADEQG